MTGCRYDRERGEYLRDGEMCKTDDYGDPTKHCQGDGKPRPCGLHVGYSELTCARCIGRTRLDIRQIVLHALLMPAAAIDAGVVNTEAANLAGPAADYRVFSARRALDRRWILEHIPASQWERACRDKLDDDDADHPYGVLTRWQLMLAEDYGHPLPGVLTVSGAAAYLERILPRMAQDEAQDFPLLAREMRHCRSHLQAVIRNSQHPERGAPCRRRCGQSVRDGCARVTASTGGPKTTTVDGLPTSTKRTAQHDADTGDHRIR